MHRTQPVSMGWSTTVAATGTTRGSAAMMREAISGLLLAKLRGGFAAAKSSDASSFSLPYHDRFHDPAPKEPVDPAGGMAPFRETLQTCKASCSSRNFITPFYSPPLCSQIGSRTQNSMTDTGHHPDGMTAGAVNEQLKWMAQAEEEVRARSAASVFLLKRCRPVAARAQREGRLCRAHAAATAAPRHPANCMPT